MISWIVILWRFAFLRPRFGPYVFGARKCTGEMLKYAEGSLRGQGIVKK